MDPGFRRDDGKNRSSCDGSHTPMVAAFQQAAAIVVRFFIAGSVG